MTTFAMEIITYSFLSLVLICIITLSTLKQLLLKITTVHMKTTPPRPLPPGPKGWPVIGCLPQMIKNRPTSRWLLELTQQLETEIACIRLGSTHVIPVTSPELAREFLRQQDEVFVSRPDCMSGRLCSDNYLSTVVTPVGPQWRKMRRILSKEVFSQSMHKFLHAKRCEEADHLVRCVLARSRDDGLVDVRFASQHYCGNVTRKLVFGKRFFGRRTEGDDYDGGAGKEEIEHVGGLFSILQHLYGFAIADYAPWLEAFDFDGFKRAINEAIRTVNKYLDPEIVERVEMWRRGIKTKEDDILDVLIKTDNPAPLSVEEIKAQIAEIMIGGIDNPSNAVEWAIAEMINQPHMFDRAYQELDRVVGRDRLVEESDLPKLNYVKSCMKESFRLHPISRFNLPHVSTKDTVVGGYFIPKGSQVLLSRPGLGRNPKAWKDALEYKPERHMSIDDDQEVVLVDHELRMISFGTGRRGCPAVVLGSTMSTMLLARLLQGFSWAAPPDGPGCIELVESKNDMFMAKPLVALARPRLELKVYHNLS